MRRDHAKIDEAETPSRFANSRAEIPLSRHEVRRVAHSACFDVEAGRPMAGILVADRRWRKAVVSRSVYVITGSPLKVTSSGIPLAIGPSTHDPCPGIAFS